MSTTTIRAEHVGSLLRPDELLAAHAEHQRGALPAERLRELEDAAAAAALKLQQDAGIQVFTDGEVRRENFMASVVETVGGLVPAEESSARPRWHRDADGAELEGEVASVAIGEPLYRRTPLSRTEARWLAENSPGPYKITMASPTMVAGFWRPGVSDGVYPTRQDAVAALAEIHRQDIADLIDAGVTWLQLDSLAYWANIDPKAARMRRVTDLDGHLSHVIDTDNSLIRAARARRPGMNVAMHFCRGNMRSAWSARGGYEPIAERIFDEVEVDRFLLEYDTERSGGFGPLRFVPPTKTVVLGLVSSKVADLESVDTLRRRIDEASQYLPLEQLAISPQCGFASTSRGNLLTVDDQRRKLELVAETARLVWG
ncbi:cobalamin-independent methionine synthase II family protein [Streptomyces sp. CA-210063]|uniref:cobalamin-independent methionine synthase II family protein n=1 Tax=Streptomyces sp. CA-210063 TaxID=2801029 RepID=UPI00214B415F|nr:cobalamin-independent methionine synthase II family protein [Streptomyces sp. CA-210063]UUU29325.1 cobalamin-independent methionine synthase II family protein [Streptomyces sp. CA-210063]